MSTYQSLFSSPLCLTWSVRVGLQFCRRRRHQVPTARSQYTASCGTAPGHWATAMQGYKSDDDDGDGDGDDDGDNNCWSLTSTQQSFCYFTTDSLCCCCQKLMMESMG